MSVWGLSSVVLVMVLIGACGNKSESNDLGMLPVSAGATNDVVVGISEVSANGRGLAVEPKQSGRAAEIDTRFKQAAAMLHVKQYKYAATALRRVLGLAPNMPEAHVNMGFAMLGMGRYGDARDSFKQAIKLKPSQVNAYYGLAIASYNIGDKEVAISALNSFIQLSRTDDQYVSKARAALTEWRQMSNRKSGERSGKAQIISRVGK